MGYASIRIPIYLFSSIFIFTYANTEYIQINNTEREVSNNRKIDPADLKNAIYFSKDVIDLLNRLEKSLNWSNIKVIPNSTNHANFILNSPDLKSLILGKQGIISSTATGQLKYKYCRRLRLKESDCLRFISGHKLHNTDLIDPHFEKSICDESEIDSKYRSQDGSCNHPFDPILGQSKTSYKRIAEPIYSDGIEKVRKSVRRTSLPSPREISTKLFKNHSNIDEKHTLNLMQWCQFILNDLSHTVTRRMVHSHEKISCCTEEGSNLLPRYEHPFCLPIRIPENDEFYSKFNVKCISYVRSLPSINNERSFGPLQQMNQATHFMDGSQIYGYDANSSNNILKFKDGMLAYQKINNKIYLPYSRNENDCFNFGKEPCFQSGDPRVNSQPLLTTLHTIFLREHNRIAKILRKFNPHWTDNILYQEARKIVIAELQHITYEEWLPIILGEPFKKAIENHKLEDYQEKIDPRISNSFATAAMKFSDSLFDDTIKLFNNNRIFKESFKTKDIFYKSFMVLDYFDEFLVTLSTQNAQKVDLNIPDDIKNHLFNNGKFGLDTISLDIQRGRDHGLPGYTTYRKLCKLGQVNNFEDLTPLIPQNIADNLSHIYKDTNDIDLLIGGLAEKKLSDGILGPTFSCILTDQFLRSKHGDKYFYTHVNQPQPFTNEQLNEIRKISLASIFCANGNIEKIQPNVFKLIDQKNYMRKCSEFPQINLTHWKIKTNGLM